jgi:hypothetical protein
MLNVHHLHDSKLFTQIVTEGWEIRQCKGAIPANDNFDSIWLAFHAPTLKLLAPPKLREGAVGASMRNVGVINTCSVFSAKLCVS